ECARGGHVASVECCVFRWLDDGARQDVKRRPTGMEVKERIAAGKNLVGNEFRNLLGDRAVNVARECAVEIQPVYRRCSRARRYSMHVDGRHEDETALNFGRIEFPDKLADRYRALIFIAMIAALEEDRRADAVLDDGDRHSCDTPCIVMR